VLNEFGLSGDFCEGLVRDFWIMSPFSQVPSPYYRIVDFNEVMAEGLLI